MPNDGTGLAYDQARYYDPSLQRFISPDPLGFGGGSLNLYSYVGNSPTNATDPSGTGPIAQCVVGAAFQVGFGAVGSALSGRKYTWGNALADAATGCVFGALDPGAFGGEIGEAAGAVERGLGEAADEDAASLSSRAARRQAMREQGIPTSQTPSSQMSTPGGHYYEYDVPEPGGGTTSKSVTNHQYEVNSQHGPHWEAGTTKDSSQVDRFGRPRHFEQDPNTGQLKSRVPYIP